VTASSTWSLAVIKQRRNAMILADGMECLLAKLPRVTQPRSHDR
jgi:hypothetical protein